MADGRRAAEAVTGMKEQHAVDIRDVPAASTPKTEQDVDMLSDKRQQQLEQVPAAIDTDNGDEGDIYALAKSYFDCREFGRAAFHLRLCVHAKSIFLRLYSKYTVIWDHHDRGLIWIGRGEA